MTIGPAGPQLVFIYFFIPVNTFL